MTSHEIAEKLKESVRRERESTNETLQLISIAMETRAYLDLGYPNMFDWLVRGFKYSGSAAYRRINAAKMLKAVPQLTRKLSEGKVNLSTVSKAESILKAQQKATGVKISKHEMAKVIEHIEDKPVKEAEQSLFALYPESASVIAQERRVTLDGNLTRHHLTFDHETSENLKRAKEVLSHKFPNGTDAEVIGYALKFLLQELDPLEGKKAAKRGKLTQSVSAAVPSRSKEPALVISDSSKQEAKRPSKASVRRTTFENAKAACEFKDPITGKICGSRYQVEIDHIVPKAMGGTDEPDNLRVLCKQHNLRAAEEIFGKRLIDKFRRK